MSNLIPGRKKGAFSQDDERMELYISGYTDTEIARELFLTQSTVWGWRKRRGLPKNNKFAHLLGRNLFPEAIS